ncbi:integration host factor subunit beta [Deferribacteraceae bacterium V6Fe1]|jgi:integration host factor subunit beta|uniref:integration host factor subunit beta n=1 Tax=Deferrivibrio essentukiensis TaxID=2880922 RepID=UPI0019B94B07|nr:integration host factor subunit beta [Deferrivibrio essentukiensis]MBC7197133.1 integration host factor subunit beta [Deferribacterales bacterium]MBZ4672181.1 integration host factor, beta subunit [Deferribacteraceae bacterium]MCB4204920.1 integration host factor subunit beta [Deferrivibrio essentukiensis]UOD34264.1 integration host factor subunit beta [Deferribacteraceae bacterium V6Fe1]
MTKSELIEKLSEEYPDMTKKQIEFIVNGVFSSIKDTLKSGGKVEIRGFGSFKVREKSAKTGRNPKTGEKVEVPAKKVPYFKPGKEIKEQLINL